MGRQRKKDTDDSDSRVSEERLLEARANDESESLDDDIHSPLYIPRSKWPEGKILRWVRIEAGNAVDNKNWSMMTRIGWTPVDRSVFPDIFPMVAMPGQGDVSDGKIIFGGLCLCARDVRLVERDKQRQQQDTASANESIKTYVEQGPSAFPRFDNSGPVQYEKVQFKE